MSNKKTQSFNAEIKQLLDIVVHSLYSNKEIFLRELVSNASDAIDKLKFEGLTKPELVAEKAEYEIRIEGDKQNKTLKIIDNGIGMSPEEVVQFIGTIARSGTKAFVQMNEEFKKRPEMIGQFGVGFYSAFMVANKVTLHTQKAGTNQGTIWESSGDGEYSIDEVPRPNGNGTTICLHLKDFAEEEQVQDFTDPWVLKGLIKKYSDFIAYPIKMKGEKDDEILNSQKALWLRPANEVSAEEHKEFYAHLSHDWNEPAKTIHYRAEGTIEFTTLMYVPSKKPWNFHMKDYEYGLNLYIKRVFIMDNCKDLLPPYLRFVKGLVDSTDLSLNVSREILQQDKQVQLIKKNVVNKLLSTFKEQLKNDRPAYEAFFAEFGSTLKEGIPLDSANKEKIAETLLYPTSQNALSTMDEYISRMQEGQKAIYFITGDRIEQVQNSPYLEKLKEKNLEVLFLVDTVDEWVSQELREYKGKKLQSITAENLDLDTEEEKKQKEEELKSLKERFSPVMDDMTKYLGQHVREVRLSDRLTQSPACLVAAEGEMSAQMRKILSQMGNQAEIPDTKRILEINPKHPVIEALLQVSAEKRELWSEVLYNQALLQEGSQLPDPMKFSKMLSTIMLNS